MDLAVLSLCDHAVYDVGSFGFWAAAMTGGEVVVADVASSPLHPLTEALRKNTPPGWTLANMTTHL